MIIVNPSLRGAVLKKTIFSGIGIRGLSLQKRFLTVVIQVYRIIADFGEMKMRRSLFIIFISLLLLLCYMASFTRLAAAELTTGGKIFIPVYRGFYQFYGSSRDSYALTSTAFLYNVDAKQNIKVISIDFYDSSGKLLKNLLDAPLLIKPHNNKEITIEPRREQEECGASLIVRWKSDQPANSPTVEVLMVGQVLNRGVSFLTRGREVK